MGKDWIVKISVALKKAMKGWFYFLGALVTVILISFFLVIPSRSSIKPIPPSAILEIDLGGEFQEKVTQTPFSMLKPSSRKILRDMCYLIEEASKEKNIQAIFVKLTSLNISLAQIQEIKNALRIFKKSGKKLYLYTSYFAETKDYFLASLFDEIAISPAGFLSLTGLKWEVPFGRKFLDKWEVKPNMLHEGQFKSAIERYTESDFSSPHKEAITSLVKSLEDILIAEIETDLSLKNLKDAFEKGYLLPQEALEQKLIHKMTNVIDFEEEVLNKHKIAEKPAEIFSSKDYLRNLNNAPENKNVKKYVALLTLSGEIKDDVEVGSSNFYDDGAIRPYQTWKQLKDIMDDEETVAIVIRIDSPGGSPFASEEIWNAIKQVNKKKPVIISMGSVAASGGYYIASAASKIVAQPTTLTGSIGIYGGKFNTSGFWESLGVHWGEIVTMESALLHSSNRDYNEKEKLMLKKGMGLLYNLFKQRVADGRKLSLEKVEQVAQGRVWTGLQAKGFGLVDELGGINEAFEIAKKMVQKDNELVELYIYTPEKNWKEALMDLFNFESSLKMSFIEALNAAVLHFSDKFSSGKMLLKL